MIQILNRSNPVNHKCLPSQSVMSFRICRQTVARDAKCSEDRERLKKKNLPSEGKKFHVAGK